MMGKDTDDSGTDGQEIDERYLASLADERFNERLHQAPDIGAFTGQLMQEQNVSYAELARAAGLNKSSVYRIVHGTRKPERDTLIVRLEVLGLPVHQISRALMFAGFAPLHHLRQAARAWPPEH